MTQKQLLERLAHDARMEFGLHVWQWLPGHVGTHARYSLHNQVFSGTRVGRAFDAYSTNDTRGRLRMSRYARWLRRRNKQHPITEVIYNGRFTKVSIKNGQHVDPSFWGSATWNAHRDHVHVGV